MQLKALASLSGPFGRKEKGETFSVGAAQGNELIGRKIAEEVPAVAIEKRPAKSDAAAEGS